MKLHPHVPELQAQMNEVQNLLKDLREGQAAHPEADQEPGQEPGQEQTGEKETMEEE